MLSWMYTLRTSRFIWVMMSSSSTDPTRVSGEVFIRRSPVYLVCEDEVGEHRPSPDLELPALLVVEVVACDVRGKQVLRELDALVREAADRCEGFGQGGLRDSGDALHENVPVVQEADHEVIDLVSVANDRLVHFGLHFAEDLASLHPGPVIFLSHRFIPPAPIYPVA